MSKIDLQNITKIYDKTIKALDDISFTVNDGEFCSYAKSFIQVPRSEVHLRPQSHSIKFDHDPLWDGVLVG